MVTHLCLYALDESELKMSVRKVMEEALNACGERGMFDILPEPERATFLQAL